MRESEMVQSILVTAVTGGGIAWMIAAVFFLGGGVVGAIAAVIDDKQDPNNGG